MKNTIITEDEYKQALKKLSAVWDCTVNDPEDKQRQFDENFKIVITYQEQNPNVPNFVPESSGEK